MGKWIKNRSWIQAGAALLTNGNLPGFWQGKIYQGPLKTVCVPGLNCYACPGALGSCPLGSFQASLATPVPRFPYYVTGLLLLFGVLAGRMICGFLCPFGFVQDLLYKIPLGKKLRLRMSKPFRGDKALRLLKYAVLVLFVVTLPLLLGDPAFCKYICPAGTLEGGLPLVAAVPSLRALVGFLYAWKVAILAAVVLLSVWVYRPFCKYLCPLGGFYGLLNPISLHQLKVDENKCTKCRVCVKACPMHVSPYEKPKSAECIRCGACVSACPFSALSMGFASGTEKTLCRKGKRVT